MNNLTTQILTHIQQHPKGLTWTQIHKQFKRDDAYISRILKYLTHTGLIERRQLERVKHRPGKPPTIYKPTVTTHD